MKTEDLARIKRNLRRARAGAEKVPAHIYTRDIETLLRAWSGAVVQAKAAEAKSRGHEVGPKVDAASIIEEIFGGMKRDLGM